MQAKPLPPRLIGAWQKASREPQAAIYPLTVEFRANGLYFARNDPESPMRKWDVGRFRQEAPRRLRVTLANDSSEVYVFILRGKKLTLTDPEGCVVVYLRMEEKAAAA
jgi:hypothetical protein